MLNGLANMQLIRITAVTSSPVYQGPAYAASIHHNFSLSLWTEEKEMNIITECTEAHFNMLS